MKEPQRSLTVGGRIQLADLCNELGIRRAVEVGTDQGEFVAAFLARWHGEVLYCVDPYTDYPGMFDRDADRQTAIHRLSAFPGRVRFVCEPSPEVASKFADKRIGFVYIDGAHDCASVMRDLLAWWDILLPGGILAGHDFDDHHPDVMRAVQKFADHRGLQVWSTTDYNQPPSWFVSRGDR